jgi:hypothetical protein
LGATYQSPAFGITFDYPAGWSITEGEIAVLSGLSTGTIHLSDQPIQPGANYGTATLTLAIQRIDPAQIYGVPNACRGQIASGPEATFTCMAARSYATPGFSTFITPFASGGVKLPGTLPPMRASLPVILLPAHNEPTWIAIMIVQWDGFADAQAMLDRVALSVR